MAGIIKLMIDSIIAQRAQGNATLEGIIRTKLMLKGVDPRKYTLQSNDDPCVIRKLEALVKDFK